MAEAIDKINTDAETTGSNAEKRVLVYRTLATVFMSLGFLCPLIGLILFLIHSLVTDDHALNGVGSGLLVASIPLLLIGSHLLDKAAL
ncbi:MAG: hypothetical protein IPJ30_06640 [Acidobacteria bacterium]|nr:hypothetical protein [Acidobacteriota bacterium]